MWIFRSDDLVDIQGLLRFYYHVSKVSFEESRPSDLPLTFTISLDLVL